MPDAPFVCHSWLLYPQHRAVFDQFANLGAFVRRFDIISFETTPDFGNAWRVFSVNYDGDPDKLPQNTRLRRAFVEYMRSGGTFGDGFGVVR